MSISDNNHEKWGEKIDDIKIIPPSEIINYQFDWLVITSEQYYMPIKKQLIYDLYIDEDKVIRLDYFSELCLENNYTE